ncbi:DUF3833 family protein [Pseudotabrizicola formosa]|uniref:DUF3833 family protein n=1 Tax=Pseudotabrizicola formosa TaxID=2030009 RepID=UPI000CD1232A|nr:DUF3833 family protein [Pseudotabrizicola formosa]
MHRRLFLLGALALGGCASAPASPTVPTRPVTLDAAFVGRKRGKGLFRVWLTGDERRFDARLDGRLSRGGQRMTVVEDFVYDDGQTDRLTWVFDRNGPGRWTGRREDTVGQATVIEENGEVRLTYTADFKSNEGVTRLGFADVIYLREDGVIVNDAVVSRAGIPVGSIRFEIRQ